MVIVKKPDWLRISFQNSKKLSAFTKLLEESELHTVCQEAACPNRHECWESGTATFLLLGDRCSRNCRFCNVKTGPDGLPSPEAPEAVVDTVRLLQLDYVVLTSVTRDDLPDGGAVHWARTVELLQRFDPEIVIETLIPDFGGSRSALNRLLAASPDLLNHNVETVPRLYSRVRPGASYARSLELLEFAAEKGFKTKSGLMLGLGETGAEIRTVLQELFKRGVRRLTLGQYLRPSQENLPVERWVHPDEFKGWKQFARALGYQHVESGPLVRSSYNAAAQYKKILND